MEKDKLSLYREVRALLNEIHSLAAAIDHDVARHQIYNEEDALPQAFGRVKQLAEIIAPLEQDLRLVRHRGEALSSSIVAASVGLTS